MNKYIFIPILLISFSFFNANKEKWAKVTIDKNYPFEKNLKGNFTKGESLLNFELTSVNSTCVISNDTILIKCNGGFIYTRLELDMKIHQNSILIEGSKGSCTYVRNYLPSKINVIVNKEKLELNDTLRLEIKGILPETGLELEDNAYYTPDTLILEGSISLVVKDIKNNR